MTRLLHDLQVLGITLQPHGDRLRFHPRDAVTPDLLAEMTEHKAELLWLLAQQAAQPPTLSEDNRQTAQYRTQSDIKKREGEPGIGMDDTPQAVTARRIPLPAQDWPAALADFVLLLAPDDLPAAPFTPQPAATAVDSAKYLAALQADILRGPAGPRARYGALQDDLRRLVAIVTNDADRRQQPQRPARKTSERDT